MINKQLYDSFFFFRVVEKVGNFTFIKDFRNEKNKDYLHTRPIK